MLVSFLGFWEYSRLAKLPGYFLFLGWVLGLGYLYSLTRPSLAFANHFVFLALFAASLFLISRGKVEGSIHQAALFLLGLVYIPGLLGFGLRLEEWVQRIPSGVNITIGGGDLFRVTEVRAAPWLLIFLWTVIWTTDTAAYFVGAKLGRFHPFPTISPNKTVEGFAGGFAGALIIGLIFFLTKKLAMGLGLTLGLAFSISLFAQMGDLFESLLKRNFEVKDASHIIAGHGGVLDRFDSFLFALPAVYFFLVVFA